MSKNILVIDDDAMNREVMEAFLEIEGYNVILASNGKQGLSHIQPIAPNLIILDVRLPDISGYDVCRQIRNTHPTLPIMIITGFSADEVRENAFAAGATDLLPRPFSGDELLNHVKDLLQTA